MPSFKAGGKEYLIAVDGPKVFRVRKSVKIDDDESRPFSQFCKDPVATFDVLTSDQLVVQNVLWVLCQKQAEENRLDQEAFESLLCGECGESAYDALLEAVIDFFQPRQRDVLRKMFEATKAATLATHEAAMKRVSDPKLAETLASKAIAAVNQAFDDIMK